MSEESHLFCKDKQPRPVSTSSVTDRGYSEAQEAGAMALNPGRGEQLVSHSQPAKNKRFFKDLRFGVELHEQLPKPEGFAQCGSGLVWFCSNSTIFSLPKMFQLSCSKTNNSAAGIICKTPSLLSRTSTHPLSLPPEDNEVTLVPPFQSNSPAVTEQSWEFVTGKLTLIFAGLGMCTPSLHNFPHQVLTS